MDNVTTTTTPAPSHDDFFLIATGVVRETQQQLLTLDSVTFIIGGVLNSYLLGSIVSSTNLRSKFRNQVICNITCLHLFELVSVNIMFFYFRHIFLHVGFTELETICRMAFITDIFTFVNEGIEDILIAYLSLTVLLQVLQFDTWQKLNKSESILLKGAIHALPWIFSCINSVSIAFYTNEHLCSVFARKWAMLNAMFTITPLCLSIIFVAVAAALQRWRGREPGTGGHPADNIYAYIVALVIAVGAKTPSFLLHHNIIDLWQSGYESYLRKLVVLRAFTEIRGILMFIPWLFFVDIRKRLRDCLPWGRQVRSAVIDLTVTYSSQADA